MVTKFFGSNTARGIKYASLLIFCMIDTCTLQERFYEEIGNTRGKVLAPKEKVLSPAGSAAIGEWIGHSSWLLAQRPGVGVMLNPYGGTRGGYACYVELQ